MWACFWKPGLRSGLIIPIVIVLWILLTIRRFCLLQQHKVIMGNLIRICLILLVFHTHTKEKLFAQRGYTVDDARWLQAEMERQALEKFLAGEYTLGKLNKDGQRNRWFIPMDIYN